MVNKPGLPRADWVEEAERVIRTAEERKVILRLIGAIAVVMHCPTYRYLHRQLTRDISDIDFVSYGRYVSEVEELFKELGYEEERIVKTLYKGRLLFNDSTNNRHTDVFFDKLEFCHDIPFKGRLECDSPTVPLAELLIAKMQIVKLNEKDVIDTVLLLREHNMGEADKETINAKRIAQLCANDWGLWMTVTTNFGRIRQLLYGYQAVTDEDKKDIAAKINMLLKYIEEEPRSVAWKMRAMIGEKKKWYREVEEVYRHY